MRSTAPGFTIEGAHLYMSDGKRRITVRILERVPGDHKPVAFAAHAIVSVTRGKGNLA